jgi:hypothetical protein
MSWMRIGAVAAAVSVAGVAPAQSPLAMHGPRILEVQRDARISAAQLAEARAKLALIARRLFAADATPWHPAAPVSRAPGRARERFHRRQIKPAACGDGLLRRKPRSHGTKLRADCRSRQGTAHSAAPPCGQHNACSPQYSSNGVPSRP